MNPQEPEALEIAGLSLDIDCRNLLLGGPKLAAAASAGVVTPGTALAQDATATNDTPAGIGHGWLQQYATLETPGTCEPRLMSQ